MIGEQHRGIFSGQALDRIGDRRIARADNTAPAPSIRISSDNTRVIGGNAARGSISGSIESATECVECRCTTARAVPRVWYSAVCSGTSLVGGIAGEQAGRRASSRDSRAGSSEPSDALVGVTSQPPSSSLTLILPEEPGVSPRSNSERPSRQISSRTFVSVMAASSLPPCLMLWQHGQAVIPNGSSRNRIAAVRKRKELPHA